MKKAPITYATEALKSFAGISQSWTDLRGNTMGKGDKSKAGRKPKKSKITVLSPEEIAQRREAEREARFIRETEAANDPLRCGPREDILGDLTIGQFTRRNEEAKRNIDRVKFVCLALYDKGIIQRRHGLAGEACLEICRRMQGEGTPPEKMTEFIDRSYEHKMPINDSVLNAQLRWKALSADIGRKASNVMYRLCMASVSGREADWRYVVRTEYNIEQDENVTRDNRYLSAILVSILEACSDHFGMMEKRDAA